MGQLTKEQLEYVWHKQGMKYNMQRFHKYLMERGLLPYINVNKFSQHVYSLLDKFLVQGMKEKPDGRQHFPSQASWSGEANDADREGESEGEAASGWSPSSEDAGLRGSRSTGERKGRAG